MDALDRPLKLHFIPFLATGHITPLCEVGRSFAAHGQHVTIITTHGNASSLQNSIETDRASGHQINIHTVNFPSKETGLPDGFENLSNIASMEDLAKLSRAILLLQKGFEDFVVQNPPDILVADFMYYQWADDLATRLAIPRLVFHAFPLFTVCAMMSIQRNPIPGQDPDPFFIPGLPGPVTMNVRPPTSFVKALEQRLEMGTKGYGLLVNSFAEFDGQYGEYYKKITGQKAWHVGPTALIYRKKHKQPKGTHKNESCLSWLDSRKPNSVLYICFGSLGHFSNEQLYEMACALESSGHNFIWVVFRKDEAESEEEKEKWMPKGFEERLREQDKGLILRDWAPQMEILGHPAVGGFMTHCGWNSVLESVALGVPMVTWPLHSDQLYNEKLVTQVHRVAVEVGVEEWPHYVFDERRKIVKGEGIENAVRRLMDEGEEGDEMRRRVKELQEKSHEAVKEGGSSHENLKILIRDLQAARDSKLLKSTN